MCYNGVLVDHLIRKAPMIKATIPAKISEDQIRKWRESVARRRTYMFSTRRRMIPAGQNRKIGRYEEPIDVDDVFGSTDLK